MCNITCATHTHTHGEGEFIKRILEGVVEVMDTDDKKLHKFTHVPKSNCTTERHNGAISKNVENSLMCNLKNCIAISLTLDESTDIWDVPQLPIYIIKILK